MKEVIHFQDIESLVNNKQYVVCALDYLIHHKMDFLRYSRNVELIVKARNRIQSLTVLEGKQESLPLEEDVILGIDLAYHQLVQDDKGKVFAELLSVYRDFFLNGKNFTPVVLPVLEETKKLRFVPSIKVDGTTLGMPGVRFTGQKRISN